MNPAEGNHFSNFPFVGTCICLYYFWFAEESRETPEFWWEILPRYLVLPLEGAPSMSEFRKSPLD